MFLLTSSHILVSSQLSAWPFPSPLYPPISLSTLLSILVPSVNSVELTPHSRFRLFHFQPSAIIVLALAPVHLPIAVTNLLLFQSTFARVACTISIAGLLWGGSHMLA